MGVMPVRIDVFVVFLACSTIAAGFHIPGHRRLRHKTKHALNQNLLRSSLHKSDVLYRSDGCITCWMATRESPRLYIPARADGVGMRTIVLLHGMAVAAYNSMNFGGAITVKRRNKCHEGASKTCNDALDSFFGATRDLTVARDFEVDYSFGTLGEMEAGLRSMNTTVGTHILLDDPLLGNRCRGRGYIGFNRYATPGFLANLRSQTVLANWPVRYKTGKPSVALHLRRGDVSEKMGRRFTPDQYYFDLVELVRRYLPNADVHVFSTTGDKWVDGDFSGYASRNMTVHLNGDVLQDWAHMMQADVFIMAKSSFSFPPALASSKCVVYQNFCYEALKGWIRGKSALQGQADLLKGCLIGKKIIKG